MANNEELILNVETTNPYVIGAVAKVEQLPNGALITIVDKNGTTTATVLNGVDGTGIASATLNDDYTLTLLFTDGTSTTTESIRGATGESGVYCGETEPTNPDVDVWIDTTGDPYPMEEEIAESVDEWITAHPEAVTTVQDGAITVPKFASGVVDATLTQTGHPADAKATGDAITADRSRLSTVEGAASSLDARVTNLATLTDGSTTGDAELIDARVVGSTTYSSLHQAIDTEFTNVKSDLSGATRNLFPLTVFTPTANTNYAVSRKNHSVRIYNSSANTNRTASIDIQLEANKTYILNFDATITSGQGRVDIRLGNDSSDVASQTRNVVLNTFSTSGSKSAYITTEEKTYARIYLYCTVDSGIGDVTYSNIILSEQLKTEFIPNVTSVDYVAREKLLGIGDVVTPQMFGAKGDGITDDTSAFQAAIDYAVGEFTLFVPKGAYLISDRLYLIAKTNFRIVGENNANRATKIIYTKDDAYLFNIHGCYNCEISNMFITNSYADAETADSAISASEYGAFWIRDITTELSDSRSGEIYITNVSIRKMKQGISVDAPTGYIYITNCSFGSLLSSADAIRVGYLYDYQKYIDHTYSVRPNYIYVKACKFEGGQVSMPSTAPLIHSFVSIYCGTMIDIRECDLANLQEKTKQCIYISPSVGNISQIVIKDNTFFNICRGIQAEILQDVAGVNLETIISSGNIFFGATAETIFERYIGYSVNRTIRNLNINGNQYTTDTQTNITYYLRVIYANQYVVNAISFYPETITDYLDNSRIKISDSQNGKVN